MPKPRMNASEKSDGLVVPTKLSNEAVHWPAEEMAEGRGLAERNMEQQNASRTQSRIDAQRPLGIATLEDKLVQRAVVEVLNAIYETDFLDFSHGFRPRRGQHDALDALATAISREKVVDRELLGPRNDQTFRGPERLRTQS